MTSAYSRYSGWIQDFIYEQNWNSLHPVQEEACHAILDSTDHVLICSDTASGKTEAALFPLLTLLDDNPPASAGILYISPLKALINDQSRRLELLLKEHHIPVVEWHGDASGYRKERILKQKQGIIQITPESLEALLITRPEEAKALFAQLPFIIIDEIHAFIGTQRGLQLQNLLVRLERLTGRSIRRIALSATVGDPDQAARWLSASTSRKTTVVMPPAAGRTLLAAQEHFALKEDLKESDPLHTPFFQFLYEQVHNRRVLIFCNSRAMTEHVNQGLLAIAKARKEHQKYYTHHGSLSAALRHEAEKAMREGNGPAICTCTVTLELGIDLGDLDLIVEIGAPWSVSSLVQRVGRSGRRNGRSRLLMITLDEPKIRSNPIFDLPWEMLRGAAELDLFIRERWIEPFEEIPKPASLLFQQTLAMLAQHNGLSVPDLAREVLTLPAFEGKFSLDEYRELLRHMRTMDYLQLLEDNSLIPGEEGDRLLKDYRFYAVFKDEAAWTVKAGSETIGTLDISPGVGIPFLLAGKVWSASLIFEEKKEIYVEAAEEGTIPIWKPTSAGSLHEKLMVRMLEILLSDETPKWMLSGAKAKLAQARSLASELGLRNTRILGLNKALVLVLWTSSKVIRSIQDLLQNGLRAVLKIKGVYVSGPLMEIVSELDPGELLNKMAENWPDQPGPDLVLSSLHKLPSIEKYDPMLPVKTGRWWYYANRIELPDLMEFLSLLEGPEKKEDPFRQSGENKP